MSKTLPDNSLPDITSLAKDQIYEPDDVREVSRQTLLALGQQAVPPLVELLEDDEDELCAAVCRLLRDIPWKGDTARRALLQACKHESHFVRSAALEALTLNDPSHPDVKEAILDAFDDEHSSVRGSNIHRLGRLGWLADPFHEEIRQGLKDTSPGVRNNAARVLGELGHNTPLIQKSLQSALADYDEGVRSRVLETLAMFGDRMRGTYPKILKIAENDPSLAVRYRAVYALGEIGITAQSAGFSLIGMLYPFVTTMKSRLDIHMGSALTRTLGQIQYVDARPSLWMLVNTETADAQIRFSASVALLQLRHDLAPLLPPLVEAWLDTLPRFPTGSWLWDQCYLNDLQMLANTMMPLIQMSRNTSHGGTLLASLEELLEQPLSATMQQLESWDGLGTGDEATSTLSQMRSWHKELFHQDVEGLQTQLEDWLFNDNE